MNEPTDNCRMSGMPRRMPPGQKALETPDVTDGYITNPKPGLSGSSPKVADIFPETLDMMPPS